VWQYDVSQCFKAPYIRVFETATNTTWSTLLPPPAGSQERESESERERERAGKRERAGERDQDIILKGI